MKDLKHHILNELADVGDVGVVLVNGLSLLNLLAGEAAGKADGASLVVLGLN